MATNTSLGPQTVKLIQNAIKFSTYVDPKRKLNIVNTFAIVENEISQPFWSSERVWRLLFHSPTYLDPKRRRIWCSVLNEEPL